MSDANPILPKVQMNLVRPKDPVIGRVVSNELCMNGKSASFVKHLVLDVSGTPLAGRCRAGQSFGVIPPGEDGNGRPHKVRLYSVANPSSGEDGDPNLLSTTPKRLIDEYVPQKGADDPENHALFLGVCSNYLCDLKPGDAVRLTGPNGKRFLLPVEPVRHNYLFLATGTGIAPFRGMILELLESDAVAPERVDLVMGVPYTTDLLYHDLFTELAEKNRQFHYHVTTSRQPPGQYVDDLLRQNLSTFEPLLADARTLIYVCGLEGMQHGLFKLLLDVGLAEGYLTERRATNSEPVLKPTGRCALEVY